MNTKVKIAVAVGQNGEWYALGWASNPEKFPGDKSEMRSQALDNLFESCPDVREAHVVWVEAEVPLPKLKVTVEGTAVRDDDEGNVTR